jgi:hypothetical protein
VGRYVSWDISGRCTAPLNVEQEGIGHLQDTFSDGFPRWQPGRTLAMQVRCRRCAACLWARQCLWGKRAVAEWKASPRTWFGTLTFGPAERYKATCETRDRLDRQGVNLESLEPVERFRELHRELGPLVTLYLKRLRKGNRKLRLAPGVFRQLITVEPHKDWTPHYHLLVHEVSELSPIREKALSKQWPHGVVHWRLVTDERAAFYAAKYLGKLSVARVRASANYGSVQQNKINDLTSQVLTKTVKTIDPPMSSYPSSIPPGMEDGEAVGRVEQPGRHMETEHG